MDRKIRRLAMLGAFNVLIFYLIIRLLDAKNPVDNNT